MNSRFVLASLRNLAKSSSVLRAAPKPTLAVCSRLFGASAQRLCPATSSSPTNVFKELSSFLDQEIKLEKEATKSHAGLPKIAGFEIKTDGPNVTLSKRHDAEEITVKFNVNGTLNNLDQPIEADKPDAPDTPMKSRPMFTVDIKRGDQVLSFSCDFLPEEEASEAGKDATPEDFQINEFAIHSGDWNDNVYTADCSVLDGQLYDLLMNLLDERGIGEQFADQLAEFSTAYEHSQYVSLLEKVKKFAA